MDELELTEPIGHGELARCPDIHYDISSANAPEITKGSEATTEAA